MDRRRQTLQLCLDPAIIVVVQIVDQLLLEMLHGLKIMQIQQLALEQSKEILNHSIVQTVALSAHDLPDVPLTEHSLILLVLVLPALIRVQDQICIIRNFLKRLVQHGRHHAQN